MLVREEWLIFIGGEKGKARGACAQLGDWAPAGLSQPETGHIVNSPGILGGPPHHTPTHNRSSQVGRWSRLPCPPKMSMSLYPIQSRCQSPSAWEARPITPSTEFLSGFHGHIPLVQPHLFPDHSFLSGWLFPRTRVQLWPHLHRGRQHSPTW